jgi:hypothetical protein
MGSSEHMRIKICMKCSIRNIQERTRKTRVNSNKKDVAHKLNNTTYNEEEQWINSRTLNKWRQINTRLKERREWEEDQEKYADFYR